MAVFTPSFEKLKGTRQAISRQGVLEHRKLRPDNMRVNFDYAINTNVLHERDKASALCFWRLPTSFQHAHIQIAMMHFESHYSGVYPNNYLPPRSL